MSNVSIPEWAKAVIVACYEEDQSDLMTDYFASQTTKTVILAWSKHNRDLFPEMRKAADLFPETHHLGTGKGEFKIWELGCPDNPFPTQHVVYRDGVSIYATFEEAEAVASQLTAEDEENRKKLVTGEITSFCPHLPYGYKITGSEKDIEHREKYSMGAGYYLGLNRRSGWHVKKIDLEYNRNEIERLLESGKHILNRPQKAKVQSIKPTPTVEPAQKVVSSGVQVNHNNEKNGIELVFAAKPDEAVRAQLKGLGFRWSSFQGLWYNRYSPELWVTVQQMFSGEVPQEGIDTSVSKPVAVDTAISKAKAEKLRLLADGMQAKIDERFTPRLSNTHRRARMAASIHEQGEDLKRIQSFLYALADGHERGDLNPVLSKISTKKEVEFLALKAILYNGTEQDAKAIGKEWWAIWTDDQLARIMEKESFTDERYLLSKIGVNTLADLKAVLLALKDLLKPPTSEQVKERQIRELERELALYRSPGYFPTPTEVVEDLIRKACLTPGMKVLEPSAGKGNIADAIARINGIELACCEISHKLRSFLEFKGHNVAGHDFLDYVPHHRGEFDVVIMNPPFEDGQDIEHVKLAYDCLKPGGRLVAIMSEGPFFRGDRKATEFRDWLDDLSGESEKLVDAFKSAERPTGINCRIVVIDKPESVELPEGLTA